MRNGIDSDEKFYSMTEEELLKIPQLGIKKVKELVSFRESYSGDLGIYEELNYYNEISPVLAKVILELNIAPSRLLYKSMIKIDEKIKLTKQRERELLKYKIKLLTRKYSDNNLSITQEQAVQELVEIINSKFSNSLSEEDNKEFEKRLSTHLDRYNFINIDVMKYGEEIIPLLDLDYFVEENQRELVQSLILSILRNSRKEISFFHLKEQVNSLLQFQSEEIEAAIQFLLKGEWIVFKSKGIGINIPSVKVYIENQELSIIDRRLKGYTLEQIGEMESVSRERIRQRERVEKNKIPYNSFVEWQYKNFYEEYDLTEEEFLSVFEFTPYQYAFLLMFKDKMNIQEYKQSKEKLMESELLNRREKERLGKKINEKLFIIEGRKIQKNDRAFYRYCVERFAVEDIEFADFYESVLLLVQSEGLEIKISSMRSFEATIHRLDNVLNKTGKIIRHYPIEQYDLNLFFSEINYSVYMDKEISAARLIEDYHALCDEYDIRDEYELHNLFKRNEALLPKSIKIGRTPILTIGNGNRDDQLLDLLIERSPIHRDEFAELYSSIYGVKIQTVKSNFVNRLNEYLYEDILSKDMPAINEKVLINLQSILNDDFYFKEDVYHIYNESFDQVKIYDYYFSELNYKNYAEFIVKDTYNRADHYFMDKYFNQELFDIKDKRLMYLGSFRKTLENLLAEHKLFEYMRGYYISIDRIKKRTNVIESDIVKFIENVAEKVGDGYFTIYSIEYLIEESSLNDLGFGDVFFESIIRNDLRFRFQYMEGVVVLKQTKDKFFVYDFIGELLSKFKRMDIYDLIDFIDEEYGINFKKENLLSRITSTDVYYHPILEKLFQDEEEFYEYMEE